MSRFRGETGHSGFSMIELAIAMLLTLIVSGAIYGLMAAGQNAFRREPELSEMQQSIRLSASLIQHDLETAGLGLPRFAQALSRGLDNLAGTPNSVIVATSAAPAGEQTDALEIFRADENCDITTLPGGCPAPAGSPIVIDVPVPLAACYPNLAQPGLLAVIGGPAGPAVFTIGQIAVNPTTPGAICAGSAIGQRYLLPATQGPASWRQGLPPAGSVSLAPFKVIRYQVAVDPADGSTALWRSETGGRDPGDGYAALVAIPGAPWQMVARGIEDLQVSYTDPAGGVTSEPVPVVVDGYGTITQQVRVTLSARAFAPNLTGQTAVPAFGIPAAVRTQLVTDVTPRPALQTLMVNRDWR